jgi:GTP-binding protein HflX
VKMKNKIPSAILVSIMLPKETEALVADSLSELERLVATLGYRVIGHITQSRSSSKSPTVIGEGKLLELARLTGGSGVVAASFQAKKSKAALKLEDGEVEVEDSGPEIEPPSELAQIAIFDCDLSPSQHRNIESAVGVPVLDRTGVIIEIFSRHAKTKAAKIQIEIARLNYTAPRLRETGGGADRTGGGIGAKGIGESKVELDRRHIRDRIKLLRSELVAVQAESHQRRVRRNEEDTVALVGYTNAGKSSLMRALTGSEVLVADKLFATLDTTVRPLFPDSQPKILVSDTVGFIKKLPHDLVASFKSTLDEALNASLLLHVVDASDSSFRSQLEVTRSVLAEVGATEVPSVIVLNKVDKISAEVLEDLKKEFEGAWCISTRNPQDIVKTREEIIRFFEKGMTEHDLFIKYDAHKGALGEIRSGMRVLKEDYDNDGVRFRVRSRTEDIDRLKKKFGL